MNDTGKQTREERLAAQLRENLKRRKAQARQMLPRESTSDSPVSALPKEEGER